MFTLLKDALNLSFTVERENVRFGDGSRVLFWIDRELGVLQRGRQEYIPLDSISAFLLENRDLTLICRLGEASMSLYEGVAGEEEDLRLAIAELNEYCGIRL